MKTEKGKQTGFLLLVAVNLLMLIGQPIAYEATYDVVRRTFQGTPLLLVHCLGVLLAAGLISLLCMHTAARSRRTQIVCSVLFFLVLLFLVVFIRLYLRHPVYAMYWVYPVFIWIQLVRAK